MLTLGGDPLHSSIATPIEDMRTPNQVRAGIIPPKMPSSKGTTITYPIILEELLKTVVNHGGMLEKT